MIPGILGRYVGSNRAEQHVTVRDAHDRRKISHQIEKQVILPFAHQRSESRNAQICTVKFFDCRANVPGLSALGSSSFTLFSEELMPERQVPAKLMNSGFVRSS